MSIRTTAAAPALDQWIKGLDRAALDAPWTQPGPLIKPKKSAMQARLWRVVAGSGTTEIDGVRHEWGEGDFFAIPPRAPHAHANAGDAPAILFSFQDVPLLKTLGFYRAEA